MVEIHTKYDIVMIGLFRSDNLLSSSTLSLVKEWSKTNRVFYIDRPSSFKDFMVERNQTYFKRRFNWFGYRKLTYDIIKETDLEFISVLTPLLLPINFLPNGKLYHFFNRYNQWLVQKTIKNILIDNKVDDYVFINSFIPTLPFLVAKSIKPQPIANIYQTLDDISQEPYIAKHGIKAEVQAFNQCDIAIASSMGLAKKYEAKVNKKINVVSNAANYHMFANAKNKVYKIPDDLVDIPKPIILYTGHYSNLRFNHELLRNIALKFPNASIVLVGSFNKNDVKENGLDKFDNIYFLGLKIFTALPAYLKHSNVAIIPYASNELTQKIYPLKVNEYLATGIPIVSSNFSEDMEDFKNVIYLANSDEEFLEGVDKALKEDYTLRIDDRLNFAKNNSWRNRIDQIESLVNNFYKSS